MDLHRVLGHQRVEEGVVLLRRGSWEQGNNGVKVRRRGFTFEEHCSSSWDSCIMLFAVTDMSQWFLMFYAVKM